MTAIRVFHFRTGHSEIVSRKNFFFAREYILHRDCTIESVAKIDLLGA